MKKILAFAAAVMLLGGTAIAQKEKAVAEKEVNVNYVKDFQRQVKNPTHVEWWRVDSLTFKATYIDNEGSRQGMVFSNKGSETHYYVDKEYYPKTIVEKVNNDYAGFTIDDLWVRKMRGKMTYQAHIVKKSGFLWWKKVKEMKKLNFEVDGKFINAE